MELKFRDLHTNIKIRILTEFFRRVLNDMVTPFMAVYLTVHFGPEVAGIMMISIVVFGILASFYGGYYADVKGRRKVVVVSEILNFLCLFGMAFCNSPWATLPLLTFLFYFLKNIVVTLSTPAGDAMMIDVSTPESRKFVYTISYWVNNMSFATGSILGAFLYQNHFFEILLASAVSSVGIFAVYALFVEETMPKSERPEVEKVQVMKIISSYGLVFRDSIFLRFLLCSVLVMGIEYQLGNYITVRLSNEFGIQRLFDWLPFTVTGINMFGILRAENTILVVALTFVLNRAFQRMSDRGRLYFGTLLFASGFMVVGMSNVGWVLILSTVIFTIGEILYIPIKQTLLADLVRDDARTQYLAVYNLHYKGAQILASMCITLGAVVPSYGMSMLFGVFGVGSLILYSGLLRVRGRRKEESLVM